jgi:hypothetical protein
LLTYLLTPSSRVLLEKLILLKLVKKFPVIYGTRRFITSFTNSRHLSLTWASSARSIYPHPTSWISNLILSSQQHIGLRSGLFPSGFPTNIRHPSPPHAPTNQTNNKVVLPVDFNLMDWNVPREFKCFLRTTIKILRGFWGKPERQNSSAEYKEKGAEILRNFR